MTLATPAIVQQSFAQALTAPATLTLPNPVTVGNLLLMLGVGGGGGGGPDDAFGFGGTNPSGWSNLIHSTTDFVGLAVYTKLATESTPPVLTVPYAGTSTQAVVIFEIETSSTITPINPNVSVNEFQISAGPNGAATSVASLYLGLAVDSTTGLTYVGEDGTTCGQTVAGVNLFESYSYTGVVVSGTSAEPFTFNWQQSAVGVYEANVGGLFGVQLSPGMVPTPTPGTASSETNSEDFVYFVAERVTIRDGVPYHYYTVEMMASRYFGGNFAQAKPSEVENAYCVDAGRQILPGNPAADLWITLENQGAIGSVDVVTGGSGYPSPLLGQIVDLNGPGAGATVSITVTAGVITAIVVDSAGSGYVQPEIQLAASSGAGAVLTPLVSNTCSIYADAAVWASGNVGDVIRASGGKAQIVTVSSPQVVQCNVLQPFTAFMPNTQQVAPAPAGYWSEGAPAAMVGYLDHLEGQSVVGLADGDVFGPLTVTDGAISLPTPASLISVGLGYTAQLQTLRLDLPGGGTIQSKRKKISAVNVRVQDTQGLYVGSRWDMLKPIIPAGYVASNNPVPFSEGGGVQMTAYLGIYGETTVRFEDQRINMDPSWNPDGQVCIQQSNPLPASVLAVVPEVTMGDT
jgi:hypothetical protein